MLVSTSMYVVEGVVSKMVVVEGREVGEAGTGDVPMVVGKTVGNSPGVFTSSRSQLGYWSAGLFNMMGEIGLTDKARARLHLRGPACTE